MGAVTCCISAVQPCPDKVLVGLARVSDGEELHEWIALVVRVTVNEIAKVDQCIGVPYYIDGQIGSERACT